MNAVEHFATLLPPEAVRRLAALRVYRYEGGAPERRRGHDVEEAREAVNDRWGDDLCGLLNAMTRGELIALVRVLVARGADRMGEDLRSPELRLSLWDRGAALERAGVELAAHLQPRPVVLGGHLVVQAPPRGMYPPSESWPRSVPAPVSPAPPEGEPETLDELLAAADRALGVRLGARGRDKGAWGNRAAQLLGVRERGDGEPDWRGDVEVKTLPVARDASGLWRVREDPAIAMMPPDVAKRLGSVQPFAATLPRTAMPPDVAKRLGSVQPFAATLPRTAIGANALAKLVRTLWLARTDLPDGDATIVSWYLLEQDAHAARLHRRYLHTRPKGPAGTDQRGVYLHKRFFADAGLLATLNGPT